ncbi:MAG: hypothetical protein HQ464_16430 [Planctomycetes bacterium]|nr:hypothetical protein [Planctomycetota bacterium]
MISPGVVEGFSGRATSPASPTTSVRGSRRPSARDSGIWTTLAMSERGRDTGLDGRKPSFSCLSNFRPAGGISGIDELVILGRALAAEEIQMHYETGRPYAE